MERKSGRENRGASGEDIRDHRGGLRVRKPLLRPGPDGVKSSTKNPNSQVGFFERRFVSVSQSSELGALSWEI